MKEERKMKRKMKGWSRLAFVVLLAMSVALPVATMILPAPAMANEEMHPGGRLFYPLWDVSGSRLTFIIITRLPLFNVDQPVDRSTSSYATYDTRNNCRPNHTTAHPAGGVFPGVNDDVHLQWYGKSCDKTDEVIKMSCGDIDLIFLSAGNLATHYNTSPDQIGALDVHFTINGTGLPDKRVEENSLLGHAVIVDPAGSGWAATYPAAAAKATRCNFCDNADGGTDVGYEPYPTEVFLPFALADDSSGGISNFLSLWAPTFFPGGNLKGTAFSVQWSWYDGRERRYDGSTGGHSIMQTLKSMDPLRFLKANFVCGHATNLDNAENDGFPRTDSDSENCITIGALDTIHTSDNLPGASKQSSTPIGWWDFFKPISGNNEGNFPGYPGLLPVRGLVGVVLTSTGDVGDATRLWHKDPCELAPQQGVGPPHLRDFAFSGNAALTNYLVFFNAFTQNVQERLCSRTAFVEDSPPGPFPTYPEVP
jgi:hypothetical protein